MNPVSTIFFLVLGSALWSVPRNWTLVPLLAGCCLMTLGQGMELGPVSLPIYRMLILIGIIRTVVRGERIVGGLNAVDKILMAWAGWYLFSSLFHDWELDAGPVYVCGQIFNLLGFYYLVRTWVSSVEDTIDVIRITALLMVPISIEMMMEKATARNLFSFFGGVPEAVLLREGRLRAQGPFLHPILAGTVGATCLPWFFGILKEHRTIALIGMAAGCVMVFTSASSGPIMSLMFAGFGLVMWKFKSLTGALRIGAVLTYIALMFLMTRPPYYLISKIDLSGGSTGWHRSFLIDTTIDHFSEWWLFGTDHTRHWMPLQGTATSPTHTDITNYYIGFAVGGGLPAMLLIMFAMGKCFSWVGSLHDEMIDKRPYTAFMIWCYGTALFSHAGTSISVAYFDQSMVFFWLNVAVISSMYSATFLSTDGRQEEEENPAHAAPGRTGMANS